MDTLYIDLNEISNKKSRVIRRLTFGAITCIALIVVSIYLFLRLSSPLEWVFLISSFYLALYIYFAWTTYKSPIYVKADGIGVDFKFGYRTNSKNYIIWDSISKVRIGYAYLAFYKKSGRRKKIQLNWLPYAKVVEIKEKLIMMCDDMRIKYEIADFIDYSTKKDIKK